MSEYPQALQIYNPRTGQARRSATCPVHAKRTSEFRGVQESLDGERHYWVFRCEGRAGHIFLATPDPTAPHDGSREEAEAWLEQHRAKVNLQH